MQAASANRRDHYRVLVHLDTGGGWLNAGPALPASLMAKLTCEGTIAPLWETAGAPVNVGRNPRIVPHRTRRLIRDRDRGCRFPGCTANRYLEVHHIVHWRDGGATDSVNLICLCSYHHDAHHRGEFLICGNADTRGGVTFTNIRGHRIGPLAPRAPEAVPGPRANLTYQHPIGEPIQSKWVHFRRPDEPKPDPEFVGPT